MPQMDALLRYGRPNLQWNHDPKANIENNVKPYVLPENQMNQSGADWAKATPKPQGVSFAFKPPVGSD